MPLKTEIGYIDVLGLSKYFIEYFVIKSIEYQYLRN
jgi:hypothetical protein